MMLAESIRFSALRSVVCRTGRNHLCLQRKLSMQRMSLIAVATLAAAVFSMVNAQEKKDKLPSYSVKFVLKGAEAESVPDEPQLIKDGVTTDIPVVTTTKFDSGAIIEEWGGFQFVPSPARLANPETKDDMEKIATNTRLFCRIRRIDEAATLLLLDVTLSDSDLIEQNRAIDILKVTTHQLRSVQRVVRGESITLSWPAAKGVEKPRQVTITVLESK